MAMWTQTLAEAAGLLQREVLIDTVQLGTLVPTIVGEKTTQQFTSEYDPIPGLVQTSSPAVAFDGISQLVYSVKTGIVTVPLEAGMVWRVVECNREPRLVGGYIQIDSFSLNGAALITKCTGSTFILSDSQGKVGP